MADNTSNALHAASRALDEVILDAIDPNHPLAQEQARLVSKYLQLVLSRLDYAYDRNRFEMCHYLNLATTLRDDAKLVSPAIAAALEVSVDDASRLQDLPGARVPDLQAASKKLAAILTALIRTAAGAETVLRQRVEYTVLQASKALLDAQRAWFLPQGWEPKPELVTSITVAFEQENPVRPEPG